MKQMKQMKQRYKSRAKKLPKIENSNNLKYITYNDIKMAKVGWIGGWWYQSEVGLFSTIKN